MALKLFTNADPKNTNIRNGNSDNPKLKKKQQYRNFHVFYSNAFELNFKTIYFVFPKLNHQQTQCTLKIQSTFLYKVSNTKPLLKFYLILGWKHKRFLSRS